MNSYDVIVIGSGIAGLNTAYQLLKKNKSLNILIIEKDSKIGGRIQTINLHNNLNYESGAIRFYPQHKNLLKLFLDFKITSKDFITIPNEFPREYHITNPKISSELREKELNEILLDTQNISNFTEKQLHKMSFEKYALTTLGKKDYEYLKVINGFPHIFQTSAQYGLELLKRDFVQITEFYILKTLTLTDFLYQMLAKLEKKGVQLNLDEEFISYKKKPYNYLEIKTNKNTYLTKKLVLAIPSIPLTKLKLFPKKLTSSTIPISLCRMYAIYPSNNYWYKNMKAIYTNENIQRIYPKGSRLIQIAYSSNNKADFWNQVSSNQIKLKKELHKELTKMFPKKEISDPDLLNVHYWPYGIHLWKKGVDYKSITNDIIQPIANQEVYICNEAYSKQQRWMEGAVEMSNRVVKHIYEK